jgi:hypothetical protein
MTLWHSAIQPYPLAKASSAVARSFPGLLATGVSTDWEGAKGTENSNSTAASTVLALMNPTGTPCSVKYYIQKKKQSMEIKMTAEPGLLTRLFIRRSDISFY